MELNKVTLNVRCTELRSKGGFYISPNGCMSPKTRHSTIWGKINYDLIPYEFKNLQQIYIPQSACEFNEKGEPESVSGFFKFSRSNFNVFAENLGMKMSCFFNTKTSYNCPARFDRSHASILDALSNITDQNNGIGSMVVSVLGENDYLYTLANISQNEQPISDLKTNLNTIKEFVFDKHKDRTFREKATTVQQLKQEYVYQYLFRDCFGDVDFTSRNSGIIHNSKTNDITLSPQFDYGEMLNILSTSKFTPPKLDSIENYDETIRPFIKQESIDLSNAQKMQKFNSSPEELGRINTYGEESLRNIDFISQKFPNVGIEFLKDLNKFNDLEYMPLLVRSCSNEFTLATNEEVEMSKEFLQSRMETYSQQLYSSLQKFAPDALENSGITLITPQTECSNIEQ